MLQLIFKVLTMTRVPLAFSAVLMFATFAPSQDKSWSQMIDLPDGETSVELFDGRTLEGWQGLEEQYWSVEDGVIVGKNETANPASTYLFTNKSYRNFRLLLEVKQTMGPKYSTMHSAVCCLGEIIEDKGQAFGFRGPLLMFCHDWGIWDAHRRNRIYPPGHKGFYQPGLEKKGDWNQVEILVIADRIRMVGNGELVIDMTDKPEMLKSSPIGLQLHSNGRPQEFRFRGLIVVENPTDELVTLN
jgi:hypothetical protein